MLQRRLQILIDEPRYARVAARARQHGTSVAAVIRDAIDVAIPADLEEKRAAWERVKGAQPMEVPELAELKREIEEARSRRL